jgi:alkaline phosphatase D
MRSSNDVVSRIVFGSCAKQGQAQPIWGPIAECKPDLFLFIGDNIYGDSEDMAVLRRKYGQLGDEPGFRALRAICPVLATWDDHDYGKNDAGAEFVKKRESQKEFLDFFGEPTDSPRRTREGVYDAKVFGPEGKRVQIILLDTRYFRSPLKKVTTRPAAGMGRAHRYVPTDDPDATVLGEAQWKWLEEQLRVPAEVRIVASSIQFAADEHGWETWGNFPKERQRLIDLIRATGANGVVIISGDRHSAELSCIRPGRPTTGVVGSDQNLAARAVSSGAMAGAQGPAYPLFDLTSSALNQPRGFMNEVNEHRVGTVYFAPNFGVIEVDWTAPEPKLSLQVRSQRGETVIREDVGLRALGAR